MANSPKNRNENSTGIEVVRANSLLYCFFLWFWVLFFGSIFRFYFIRINILNWYTQYINRKRTKLPNHPKKQNENPTNMCAARGDSFQYLFDGFWNFVSCFFLFFTNNKQFSYLMGKNENRYVVAEEGDKNEKRVSFRLSQIHHLEEKVVCEINRYDYIYSNMKIV